MLWFSVWTLLVVGTLVGAFFLLRRLYRSGRALAVELSRASEVLAHVAERAQELAEAGTTTPAPVDLSDVEAARARHRLTRAAGEPRRAARALRHEAAYRRWRAFSR